LASINYSKAAAILAALILNINSFYLKPDTLLSELAKEKNKDIGKHGNFFSCPASSNFFKNTYVFKSPTNVNYEYDFTDIDNPIIKSMLDKQPKIENNRLPTLQDKPILFVKFGYVFFAEEPVEITFTPPFLTEPKYTKYGTAFTGSFDISQWFRPYTMEMQMWNLKGSLIIEKNEPIFYVTTDKQIKLNGFNLNEKLFNYMSDCISSPKWQGKNLPLSKRYEVFKEKKMDELILSEIKKNLL
jgi:hypothetical protein